MLAGRGWEGGSVGQNNFLFKISDKIIISLTKKMTLELQVRYYWGLFFLFLQNKCYWGLFKNEMYRIYFVTYNTYNTYIASLVHHHELKRTYLRFAVLHIRIDICMFMSTPENEHLSLLYRIVQHLRHQRLISCCRSCQFTGYHYMRICINLLHDLP